MEELDTPLIHGRSLCIVRRVPRMYHSTHKVFLLQREIDTMSSRRSSLFQALTLWFVVVLALTTASLSGPVEVVVRAVGLGLFFTLPLYVVGTILLAMKDTWTSMG